MIARGPFVRVVLFRHSPDVDQRNHGTLPTRAAGRYNSPSDSDLAI